MSAVYRSRISTFATLIISMGTRTERDVLIITLTLSR